LPGNVVQRCMLVAAWVPYADSLTPSKTIAEMQAARIGTAVLMVNDFSSARGPTPFRTFDVAKLVAMADACHAAGIAVWLCSWLMPHTAFVSGAITQLSALRDATRAEMIVWDAEAPYTEATGSFNYDAAVRSLSAAFGSASMAVTAIASAPLEIKSLVAACSVRMPQCYATTDSQATPPKVVPFGLRCWTDRYGTFDGRWVVGLAAYDQATDPGVTMWPPLDDLFAVNIRGVCYWTSSAIAARVENVRFVAELQLVPHPGICRVVDIAALPSAIPLRIVEQIQTLLEMWTCDPGPIDGKPGDKTLAAVKTFQARRLLASTGIVDATTWAELLRP
jgi:hypothetical protein